MSTVLFDPPGPVARARHRTMTIVAVGILVVIAAWVIHGRSGEAT